MSELAELLIKLGAPRRTAHEVAVTPAEPDKQWGKRLSERSLYVWGDVGRGKTYLAVTLLAARLGRYSMIRAGQVVSAEGIADQFKKAFDGVWPDTETLRLRFGKEYPWLCIDDVGRGHDPNGYAVNVIDSIVAKRTDELLPTVITTQISPERFRAKYGDAGARIISRILDRDGAELNLDGHDRRKA